MRDRDKLRRVKRANEVQAETLDEYRNTIKFLELKVLRLETEIEQSKEIKKQQIIDAYCEGNNVGLLHNVPIYAKKYYNETFKTK